jgi:hypothetical protein
MAKDGIEQSGLREKETIPFFLNLNAIKIDENQERVE